MPGLLLAPLDVDHRLIVCLFGFSVVRGTTESDMDELQEKELLLLVFRLFNEAKPVAK